VRRWGCVSWGSPDVESRRRCGHEWFGRFGLLVYQTQTIAVLRSETRAQLPKMQLRLVPTPQHGSFKFTLRSKVRKQERIRSVVPILRLIAVLASVALSVSTQPGGTPNWTAKNPPKFEDFPAGETMHGTAASVKLSTRSERMFQTRLTKAAKEPPNFAGHYRIAYWGCGSNCSAAALVDLQTGEVFPPPLAKSNGNGWERWMLCTACFEGSGDEFHVDSRLMMVRCGMNYSERLQKNFPDTYYFVWDYYRFRQILFVPGNQPGR